MMVHVYNSSTWEAEAEGSRVQGKPGLQGETSSQKTKDWGYGSVVQHFCSKLKALSSILSTGKKEGKER
jgi:hypothetical protein